MELLLVGVLLGAALAWLGGPAAVVGLFLGVALATLTRWAGIPWWQVWLVIAGVTLAVAAVEDVISRLRLRRTLRRQRTGLAVQRVTRPQV
jgi:hypothetical protein